MASPKVILAGVALVAGAALWYLFRPEALIIDRRVNEPLLAMAESTAAMLVQAVQRQLRRRSARAGGVVISSALAGGGGPAER